ncbi:hypothetical protein A606_00165 [Corynebacterium terpenotabidum Y-11]|uniref:Uncharacterized protein n=1 Tax=Corynebacterium terpenotabidum Y-11 TaxID=1200352 RepID=S4XAN5_9CORY|nr:hypothetical protein A606_00165 [Corynebacterium terpenotabidum Y-11]
MEILHPNMNDGFESDTWADDLTITESFDRPEHVSWANRKRPTTPPRDPWNGPIDQFLDYLTGTTTAPPTPSMSRITTDPWE